jgi:hypothetical protein
MAEVASSVDLKLIERAMEEVRSGVYPDLIVEDLVNRGVDPRLAAELVKTMQEQVRASGAGMLREGLLYAGVGVAVIIAAVVVATAIGGGRVWVPTGGIVIGCGLVAQGWREYMGSRQRSPLK